MDTSKPGQRPSRKRPPVEAPPARCPTCGARKTPVTDEEADRLRMDIVRRMLALRCRNPKSCRHPACRRANTCMRQRKDDSTGPEAGKGGPG